MVPSPPLSPTSPSSPFGPSASLKFDGENAKRDKDKAKGNPNGRHGICLARRTMNTSDPKNDTNLAPLMGRSSRHPITGNIQVKNAVGFKDFVVVDLFRRGSVQGALEDLMEDPYLFRPYPLPYRTWIYHWEYANNRVQLGSDEHAIVRRALGHQCIDAPTRGGRWSPIMCLVPMAMFISLVDDMTLLAPVLFMVIAGQNLSNSMNSIHYYKYLRLVSLLPRWLYYAFLFMRFSLTIGSMTGLGAIGFLAAVVCVIVDIFFGDLTAVRSIAWYCHYEVMIPLPNRVFICRRVGAAWMEDTFGTRGQVSEKVTGFPLWDKTHTLIADIQGMLMELRPITRTEWETLYDQNVVYTEPMAFLGLDLFTRQTPDWKCVCQKKELMRKKRESISMGISPSTVN